MKINKSSCFIIASAILFAGGCKKESEGNQQWLRNVIVAKVTTASADSQAVYAGVVEEGNSISAAFMADGKIDRIDVKEGDRVRRGQLLATLDDSDYRIGVEQLRTQLEQMTREKERMDAMFARHNIAPNDYEKFEAGYKQLKLQLEMAERKLDYTRLYSPCDGYIATVYLSPGELAGAGTPVFNITDDSRLLARVDLPISVYQEKSRIVGATGTVAGVKGDIPLTVISFTPDADNNMLYRLKLSIPAQWAAHLSPGMNISVRLETEGLSSAEILIPSRAIFKEDGLAYVWVYDSELSEIHKREITVVGAPRGKMSVVEGLVPGMDIVETGVRQLYEGEKVNVSNRAAIEEAAF